MEVIQREVFFSKQGKASAHNHSILFTGTKQRPKTRELNLVDPSDTESIEKLKNRIHKKTKKKELRPNSSFRSVSREQRDQAFRNKTNSPFVGLYTPKYTVVDARVNQGPVFKEHTHMPRKKKVEIPNCLNRDLECSFPNHDRFRPKETLTVNELEKKMNNRKISTKSEEKKLNKSLPFKLQTPRKPFVSEDDPPNQKRFDYVKTASFVYSGNKRPKTVLFNKMIPRKELIEVKSQGISYDVKESFVRPRNDTDVLNFSLMGTRKPLILKERLETPDSPALEVLERAFLKQSGIRGVHQIPKISTMKARDDEMYKTTEAYSLNNSSYLKLVL